jgi:hypothetical protein
MIDVRPNPAQSGAVLAAVKAKPPLAVSRPLVGPALTAAATRRPSQCQVGTEKRCLGPNKETGL